MTPEDKSKAVADLYAYMLPKYDAKLVDKNDSSAMKFLAQCLDTFKVMDKDLFLNGYVQTIYRSIYVPYYPGQLDHKHFTPEEQVDILPHELTHIIQMDREGLITYNAGYIAHSSTRAIREAEAYRCQMEMHFRRTGKILDPDRLIKKLNAYKTDEDDRLAALQVLRMAIPTIKHGGVISKPVQETIAWLEAYRPEMLEG